MKYYCKEVGCNNIITKNTFIYGQKRCQSCANKTTSSKRKGKMNGAFKHGNFSKYIIKYCIELDCNNKVSKNGNRCYKHSKKGKRNPQYKKGDFVKDTHFCIEINCNNKVSKKGNFCKSCVFKGERSPVYFWGVREYPLCFNEELKIFIRNFYEERCYLCRISSYWHKKLYGFRLHIHHVDYDKNNCEIDNLVPLCIKCHKRTTNKKQREFYTNLILRNIREGNLYAHYIGE